MKPRLLLLMFLLLPFTGLQRAMAESMMLVVLHNDGSRSTFLLSDKPEISFSGSDCVFASQTNSITIARKDVADFHFETESAGIGKVEKGEARCEFIDDCTLRITGVKTNAVRVYDILGNTVNAEIQGTGQSLTVSLQQLPQGIYVIKYSGNSIKINKR